MANLFGKYCYINTPWIAGYKTRYRIIGSGGSSNTWCDVPLGARANRNDIHEQEEEIVFVILDTLVDDNSHILRVALRDIDLIEEEPAADVRENKYGHWIGYPECLQYPNAYADHHIVCSECEECFSILSNEVGDFYFCPHCGARIEQIYES